MNTVKKPYTLNEKYEAVIAPVSLTAGQQQEAKVQLAIARKSSQQDTTAADKMKLLIYQLRFEMEEYIKDKNYNPALNFGFFLKRYIEILGLKRKDFAAEINIDDTLLSQFINMHRTPPDYIFIRLELHSQNIITADLWYKIGERQKEYFLKTDELFRKNEAKNVRRQVTA